MATHIKIRETKNGAYYSETPRKSKKKGLIIISAFYKKYYKNCYDIKKVNKFIVIRDKMENVEYSMPAILFNIKDCGKYWELS